MQNKSPLKWVGGKFYQRHKILNLIPPHKVWCEVFGGAGHITFAKNPSKVEVYNDINSDLVNFFLIARDRTDELIERLDTLPYSRQLYMQYRTQPLPDDLLNRAVIWFYNLHNSFGGKINSGWAYGVKRSHAHSFRSAIQRINIVRNRFKNILIENVDFKDCIQKYDSDETVFFIDPPYDGSTDYYKAFFFDGKEFTAQDHINLANMLNNIKGKAIVTYYPTTLIQSLYPEPKWNWIYYDRNLAVEKKKESNKRTVVKEVIILNFLPEGNLFEE